MPTALQSYLMYKQAAKIPFNFSRPLEEARRAIQESELLHSKLKFPKFPEPPYPDFSPPKLKTPLTFGEKVKQFFVGQPKTFLTELNQGEVWKPHSVLRQSFHAPGMLSKGLLYGLPALEMTKELRDDRPEKAKRIGQLLGGTALGLTAFGPTGMIGATALGGLGAYVGGTGGRLLEHLTRPAPEYPEAINQIYQQ